MFQPSAFEDRGDSQLIFEFGSVRAAIALGLVAGEPGPETSNNSGNAQQNTLGSLASANHCRTPDKASLPPRSGHRVGSDWRWNGGSSRCVRGIRERDAAQDFVRLLCTVCQE